MWGLVYGKNVVAALQHAIAMPPHFGHDNLVSVYRASGILQGICGTGNRQETPTALFFAVAWAPVGRLLIPFADEASSRSIIVVVGPAPFMTVMTNVIICFIISF